MTASSVYCLLLYFCIENKNLAYLFECVSVMQPISIYLDLLQGEDCGFLGHVLSTLTKIRENLEGLLLEKGNSIRDKLLEKFEQM